MSSFTDRLIRAAKLDGGLYEEVEADQSALSEAVLAVVLASAAAGIGSISQVGIVGIITGTILSLLGWVIWAYLIFVIGTKLFPEKQTQSDVGELLRTIGFSSAPGIIRVLGIVPFLTNLVYAIASIWMLVAMIVAVRQALDYKSTWRAVGVCVLGWVIQIIVFVGIASLFVPKG